LPISLLSVAFAGSYPLAPFVVGDEGADDDGSDDDGEEDFHGVIRIARNGWVRERRAG
jgi:hypothetical protein